MLTDGVIDVALVYAISGVVLAVTVGTVLVPFTQPLGTQLYVVWVDKTRVVTLVVVVDPDALEL